MGKKAITKKTDGVKKSEGGVTDGEKTTESNGVVKKKKRTTKKTTKKEQPQSEPENGVKPQVSSPQPKVKKTSKKSKSNDLQKSNHKRHTLLNPD